MKILIFGKNGFVASNLISKFKEEKIKFRAFSKKELNLLSESSSKKLRKTKKGNYKIIFLSTLTPDKGKDEVTFIKNITMISNFFKFFPIKYINHFIYISSDAVFNINDKMISDRTKPDPQDLYGFMHLIREKIIQAKIAGRNYTILRPVAVYGPGDTHNSYGPNRFSRQLKNNEKINIFGKGLDVRSHLYIQDLVKIIYLVNNKKIFGTLNISPLKSYSFIDVAKKIINNFDKNLKYKDHINFIKNNKLPTKRRFKDLKINKFFKSKDMTDINKGLYKLMFS